MRYSFLALLLVLAIGGRTASADIVLEPGQPFTAETARLLLASAFPELGVPERLAVSISSPALPLANTATAPVHLALAELWPQGQDGGFMADIVVAVVGGPTNHMTVRGRAEPTVILPTPVVELAPGIAIRAEDLILRAIPRSQVPDDVLVDPETIAGQEVVRRIAAGDPVREMAVRPPVLVQRNQMVTVIFQRTGLRLTVLGRAIEDGHEGEPVRVLNLDSRREIRGVVTGPKTVRVGAGAKL